MGWWRGKREAATLRRELRGLLNILCPTVCRLCSRLLPHPGRGILCPACCATVVPLPAAHCSVCALPFGPYAATPHRCEECLRQPPPFSAVVAGGLYLGGLRLAIQHFKFSGRLDFDHYLATQLGVALRRADHLGAIDLVIGVPLHPARLRERTYNQAGLLAREIARRRRWIHDDRILLRQRLTDPQSGLSREERQRNLAGAFTAPLRLDGAAILLIDDVMTTGATAREGARTLLDAGAARVTIGVVARAPRQQP